MSEEWRSAETARAEELRLLYSELEQRLGNFIKVQGDPGLSYSQHEMHDRLLRLEHGIPAVTLTQAIDSLYAGDTRLLAQLFMNTVRAQERQMPANEQLDAMNNFLDIRHYAAHQIVADEDTIVNQMVFSQPGQADYQLELHLCALLSVFRRLMNTEIFAKRWIPAGYHLMKRGFVAKDAQNGTT